MDITLRKNVFANVSSRWQDRNGMYDRFDKNTQTFEGQTEHIPFSTTDIKMYWQKNHFQIFTECLNIFNTQYADFGNIPMPGRMYRWGVKAEIHIKNKAIKLGLISLCLFQNLNCIFPLHSFIGFYHNPSAFETQINANVIESGFFKQSNVFVIAFYLGKIPPFSSDFRITVDQQQLSTLF